MTIVSTISISLAVVCAFLLGRSVVISNLRDNRNKALKAEVKTLNRHLDYIADSSKCDRNYTVEEDDAVISPDDSGEEELAIPCKYLVKVDTEAEEDARIRQKEAELDAFRKSGLDRVLYPEKSHTYEVTVDNVAMDWQRYEADLAKEIALKVANKFNDPKEAAEYAVSVAKAVVENLKKK